MIADVAQLTFYVDRDGDVRFVDRQQGRWSEHIERQAKRRAR